MSFFISNAYAAAAPAGTPAENPTFGLVFFIGMIVVFYFLLIRPQQKRAKEHRQMVEAVGKGDEIVTNGGILGKIIEVSEQYLSVEIADGVTIRLQRNAIASVLPKGSLKAAEKE